MLGDLQSVVADYSDPDAAALARVPGRPDRRGRDRGAATGITTAFFSAGPGQRSSTGPWAAALSRVLRPAAAAGRGRRRDGSRPGRPGAASLISRASLAAGRGGRRPGLGRRATLPDADRGRRRRRPRGGSLGRAAVRIGGAVVGFHGHVGRCLVTSRDPETGEVDLPTLDILGDYRVTSSTHRAAPVRDLRRGARARAPSAVGDPVERSTREVRLRPSDELLRQSTRNASDRGRRSRRGGHADPRRQAQRARRPDVRGDHRRRRATERRARRPGGRAPRRRAELLLRSRRDERHGRRAAASTASSSRSGRGAELVPARRLRLDPGAGAGDRGNPRHTASAAASRSPSPPTSGSPPPTRGCR